MTKKEIGEMVKARRLSRNLTRKQLGELVGVSESAIGLIETGKRSPSEETTQALADAFNIPVWAIRYSNDEMRPIVDNIIDLSDLHTQKIPLLGEVAGGEPIPAEESFDVWVEGPINAQYALRVKGHSMEPNYMDGDIVYIHQVPDVSDGQVAVVLMDDSATLKRVYHQDTGLLLMSDNPAFKPILAKYEECAAVKILGKPVGFTRIFG